MAFRFFRRSRTALFFCVLMSTITGTLMPFRNMRMERSRAQHFARKKRVTLNGDIDIINQDSIVANDVPPFHAYFSGMHTTTDSTGLYSFVVEEEDKEMLNGMSLIICKRLQPHFEQGTTLSDIEISKLNKAEWYDLVRSRDEKNKKYYWDYKKREIKPGDKIPANAIVLLLSSARVVRVEKTVQTMDGPTDLPKIVLESDMAKLKRASTKSAIEAITLRRLTDERSPRTRRVNGVYQSLAG